jgi:hypothetical protein
VHVTNLNDSGTGSFRAAMGSNRNIVFDVGGSITLNSEVIGTGLSNLSIDGTTAPSPGITFLQHGIQFRSSHNIILKNFRHRAGDYGGGDSTGDGGCIVFFPSCYDLVVDHISVSGYTDEAIDFYDGCYDFTIQNCILGVASAGHTSLQYMMGNKSYNGTFYHNLSYLGGYRSPAIGWDTDGSVSPAITGDVVNCVDWKYISYGVTTYLGAKSNVRGCYFYSITHPGVADRALNIESLGSCYSTGNYSLDSSTMVGNAGSAYAVDTDAQITASSAAAAFTYVKENAGCRVGGLDTIDTAIIADVVEP